ncbi:hypothetical protein MAP00_005278 [Monascus purpureus]|nr:hypothetical protein MAP00_005278 [Monascus purpureus]
MDFHLAARGPDRNYTGFLTKTIVYMATLVIFLLAFAFTLSSIIIPKWISYNSDKPPIHYSYGLTSRCSWLSKTCEPFPQRDDCHGEDRYFCSMWRSVSFLMTFAVVVEGICIVAYLVILTGGKRLRESGWRFLAFLILIAAIVQAASMALVAYLYDNEPRFFAGWKLDESWACCTASWCLTVLCAGAIVIAAKTLPSEGGYELIPDQLYE